MAAKFIGAHMPTSGGIGGAIREGKAIGCTSVQVFTSSPRQWKSVMPSEDKVKDYQESLVVTGIKSTVSHDSYLINLADSDAERREKSKQGLLGEMKRCSLYGVPYVVSHMGAHLGQGEDEGLHQVAEAALEILAEAPQDVTLLMETTAGQGTCLNYKFEHLAKVFALTQSPNRLQICIDTCHLFAAGYDLRTESSYHETFKIFDDLVGVDKIKVIHCNDSKKPLGSRVDRHENLGDGAIGALAFKLLVNDPRFEQVPIIVETPIEDDGHAKNVAKLWKWCDAPK